MNIDIQFTAAPTTGRRCATPSSGRGRRLRHDVGVRPLRRLDDRRRSADARGFTLLGALAEATSTIGLGTLVANAANRHPALLAAARQRAADQRRPADARHRCRQRAGTRWAREHDERGITLHADVEDRHAAVASRSPRRACRHRSPIIIGANSVALARLAGEIADGVNVRMGPTGGRVLGGARAAGERVRRQRLAFVERTTPRTRRRTRPRPSGRRPGLRRGHMNVTTCPRRRC